VIASYYALFAVIGASRYSTLGIEIAVGLVFSALAVLGFKKSMWLAAAGIAGHGFFDFSSITHLSRTPVCQCGGRGSAAR